KGHRANNPIVVVKHMLHLPSRHLPYAYGLVETGASQPSTVGTEGQAPHFPGMPRPNMAELARGNIPQAHEVISTTSDENAPVGAEGKGGHTLWVGQAMPTLYMQRWVGGD